VLLAGGKFVFEIKLTVFPQRLAFDLRWQQKQPGFNQMQLKHLKFSAGHFLCTELRATIYV